MSIDRPGYVPNPRYEGSVYQLLDEQEAEAVAYRRETEAIERDAVRIRRIREQLLRDLAAAPVVLPQDGQRLSDKEGC